jgi:hypothetical protein
MTLACYVKQAVPLAPFASLSADVIWLKWSENVFPATISNQNTLIYEDPGIQIQVLMFNLQIKGLSKGWLMFLVQNSHN